MLLVLLVLLVQVLWVVGSPVGGCLSGGMCVRESGGGGGGDVGVCVCARA